jgi:DNA processing protein
MRLSYPQVQVHSTRELLGFLGDAALRAAPDSLYMAGDPKLLSASVRVAIVGSRQASEAALRRASRLAREVVAYGAVVVSGLARGVDTAALRSAIGAGGQVAAVLGTPLEVAYPDENASLQLEIGTHHCLVSHFPPGHPPGRGNFPRRNRLMALLTDATVIVEAGDSSGTLSQGWEAIRLNRPLFILRSVVENDLLQWPDEMLRYGARILSDPQELLDALPEPGVESLAGTDF